MKALVLSGGKGTRLRPLTHTMAKQLVPVANQPVLHYVMHHLAAAGLTEVGIIISPETGGQIREALQSNPWGLSFTFIVQEQPLGLAQAVKVARPFLGTESFVMYLGDNLIGSGLTTFIEAFVEKHADVAILLKEVDNPQAFGVAEVDHEGRVVNLIEKPKVPPSNLALVGAYVFSPAIHDAIDAIAPSWRGELEITDAIRLLLEWGHSIHSTRLASWWLDTGKKDDLLEANRVVLDEFAQRRIEGEVDVASKIFGRVTISAGARISGSTIRGPAIIGKNTIVEDSFIGPFTSIGDHCQVIHSAVEHTVLLDGAQIRHVPRLDDSVLGKNAIVSKQSNANASLRLLLGDDSEILL